MLNTVIEPNLEASATQPEVTQESGTPPVASATEPQTQTESFFNPDGTLKPGWQNSELVPKDFAGRKVYNAVGNSVSDLLKHIGNQDIAISRQGKGVFIPGPDATQTEKDLFYKALGRPDTPDGYKIEIPKGLEDHYPQDVVGATKSEFHKLGLNPDQVKGIMALDAKRVAGSVEDMQKNPLKYYEHIMPLVQPILKAESEKELRSKWGDNYNARLNLANRAITENTKEGPEREALLSQYGNDPVFADFIATLMQKHFTEGTGVDTTVGGSVPALNLDQRIEELMQDKNYLDGRTNPAAHKRLVDQVQGLMAQKRK